MYAIELPERTSNPAPNAVLKLVWSNPNPVDSEVIATEPLVECRSRRQAQKVVESLGHGYIVERRQGDRLVLSVFPGTEPTRLLRVPGVRTAA